MEVVLLQAINTVSADEVDQMCWERGKGEVIHCRRSQSFLVLGYEEFERTSKRRHIEMRTE